MRAPVLVVLSCVACGDDDEGPCGQGTLLEKAVSEGRERWCENDAGQADGFYELRSDEGVVVVDGAFDAGLADGPWLFMDADGALIEARGYYHSLPHGTWTTHANGEVTTHHTFAYGVACGVWRDADPDGSGALIETDYGECVGEAPAQTPTAGEPAPVVFPVWDRATCGGGRALVDDDALDPNRAACAKDGVLDGPWSRTIEAGGVVIEGAHVAGLLDGTQRRWSVAAEGAPGALSEDGAFSAGLKDSAWLTWRPDGSPIGVERWVRGAREGVETVWHRGGARAREGAWRADKRDGVWSSWNDDGIEIARETWVAGVLDGPASYHFGDGHSDVEGGYVDGLRSGTWTWSWPRGGKRDEGPFVAGVEEGHFRTWTAHGQPDSEGERVAGRAQGQWTLWTYLPDAVVRETGAVVDGAFDGLWSGAYQPGGQRSSETLYAYGKRNGAYRLWFPDGDAAIEGAYLADRADGVWRRFDEDRQKVFEGEYANGEFIGTWTFWWPDGSQRAQVTWVEGVANVWQCWDASGAGSECPLQLILLGELP